MPISRKVTRRKDGVVIISLPKSWVDNIEKKTGKKLTLVDLEINGAIIITPSIEEETEGEK